MTGPFISAISKSIPRADKKSSRWTSSSIAVVSISVIGSAARMTTRTSGERSTTDRTKPSNSPPLAKNSGASNRTMTIPGRRVASPWRLTSWYPRIPGIRPSSARYGRHAWLTKATSDSAMAMPMPGSTPTKTTPTNAEIDNRASTRSTLVNQASVRTSTSELAATMTIAARADGGQVPGDTGGDEDEADDEAGPDESAELRACSRAGRDGAARRRGGHREPAGQPGRQVGRADGRHLLAAVDGGPVPGGECSRQDAGVGEGDEGDAERRHGE